MQSCLSSLDFECMCKCGLCMFMVSKGRKNKRKRGLLCSVHLQKGDGFLLTPFLASPMNSFLRIYSALRNNFFFSKQEYCHSSQTQDYVSSLASMFTQGSVSLVGLIAAEISVLLLSGDLYVHMYFEGLMNIGPPRSRFLQ